ncbi:DNA damage-regulated autophagy modulator protein 1-like [Oscarella lobularis]|uniref:DNA damage-regulated autophagy modulator protein 1-like n=1 Tax=Oscarella lobularis TaxID=121494 RepID=UPI0033139219
MAVYGSIPVKLVTYTTVGITTTTIFLCYALAVGLGHVPAWLPMISDCAVESPEKYPFRLGIISGATALIANVLLVYSAFPSFSLRKTSAAFGVVASVGLAIVGAVNEEEDNTVHSVAAVSFFLFYDIYMTIICFNAPRDQRISKISLINKRIFALLGIILLVTVGILAALGWDKYKTIIAVCEWGGTLAIEIFNLSFAFDMAGITLEEVSNDAPPRYSDAVNDKKQISVTTVSTPEKASLD